MGSCGRRRGRCPRRQLADVMGEILGETPRSTIQGRYAFDLDPHTEAMRMSSTLTKALSPKELLLLLYRTQRVRFHNDETVLYLVVPEPFRPSRPLETPSCIFGNRCASHSYFADHDLVTIRTRMYGTSKYPKMRLNFVPYSDRQGIILQVAQKLGIV